MKTKDEMDAAYFAAMTKWGDENDPETAFAMFSQLAAKGDASSQNCLGIAQQLLDDLEKTAL